MAVTLTQAARDEIFDEAGTRVWLVELSDPANGTHYLTNYSDTITWSGSDFSPEDIELSSNAYKTGSDKNPVTMKIGNKEQKPQGWISDNSGLEGEDCTLRTISPNATGNSDDLDVRPMQVDHTEWNETWATFRLVPFYESKVLATEPIERTGCGKFIPSEIELMYRHIESNKTSSSISSTVS